MNADQVKAAGRHLRVARLNRLLAFVILFVGVWLVVWKIRQHLAGQGTWAQALAAPLFLLVSALALLGVSGAQVRYWSQRRSGPVPDGRRPE